MTPRNRLINALETMPEEAFSWFVLATAPSAMLKGANTQIWPDGIGGFQQASKDSITEVRAAAEAYIAAGFAIGESAPDANR